MEYKRNIKTPNEIIIHEDYAELVLYNKSLKPIGVSKIDIEDVVNIEKYKWTVCGVGYIRCWKLDAYLHRYVMNLKDKKLDVHHINTDKNDNRKCNLKVVKRSENLINQKIQSNNVSGTKGVSYNKQKDKWQANIQHNKKLIYLGNYQNKKDAIEARKEAELKYCINIV